MLKAAYLVLENGTVFAGEYFGAQGDVTGEIVFTTSMVGYLETLTDKSYHGQIVLQTFPLIGNYGVIPSDFEGSIIGPAAYIGKYPCQDPSNFRSEGSLDTFLHERGIIGLCGIDTRQLTKIIRKNGVMNGKIMREQPTEADLDEIRSYKIQNPVSKVSAAEKKLYKAENAKYTVALYDFGTRDSLRNELEARGCDCWVFPYDSKPEDVLAVSPDGIVLSNGPGDPAENDGIIDGLKAVIKSQIPIFAVGLGHQLLALANGFRTSKLKYGHRGANQPVRDMQDGKVYVTSQNHGYTVASGSVDGQIADEWFVNVNDGTCEGIAYKNMPALSVQFYPETGGNCGTAFVFDRFIKNMEVKKNAAG